MIKTINKRPSIKSGEKNAMEQKQENILNFLYKTKTGAVILKILTKPFLSKIAGMFLNTKVSCLLIDGFITSNNIDITQYQRKKYISYNDFFTRKIRPELRPICNQKNCLISPCDGKVTAFKINENSAFKVKNTIYTLKSLLQNKLLADKFINGYCVILRLCVDDYHRYCFVDNGKILSNVKIDGVLHTVNPIANDNYHIYKENSREYTIIKSENFGNIIQMEVGALMVGKIVNTRTSGLILKGLEKGYFEFGGSTIILLLQDNTVVIDNDILKNSASGIETIIKYGEQIGICCQKN